MAATITPIRASNDLKPIGLKVLLDRYGENYERRAELKAQLKLVDARHAEYETEILSRHESLAAHQGAIAEGDSFLVEVSPRKRKRTVLSVWKIYKISRLKLAEFLDQACNVALGWVDDHIDESKHHLFLLDDKHGGERALKAIRKTAQSVAA